MTRGFHDLLSHFCFHLSIQFTQKERTQVGFSELQSSLPLCPTLDLFLLLSENIPHRRPCAAPERSVIFLDQWEILRSVFSLLDNPTLTMWTLFFPPSRIDRRGHPSHITISASVTVCHPSRSRHTYARSAIKSDLLLLLGYVRGKMMSSERPSGRAGREGRTYEYTYLSNLGGSSATYLVDR